MGFVRRRAPALLVVALVLVGGAALVTGRGSGEASVAPEPEPVVRGEEAISRFLEAWESGRTGTYVVRSAFRRIRTTGQHFEHSVLTVQSPPDHLTIDGGSVAGVLDGVRVACSVDDEGERQCREGETVPSDAYDRAVVDQLATLEGYVTGPDPLYEVAVDAEDCFVLDQQRPLPAAPYGTRARFCFDPGTGAPTFTEIARPEGTDRLEAVEVRGEVTEQDLTIPPA